MEVKDGERVVIAKPVASRPSSSPSFRTFTELLTDSVTVSPQSNCHEIVDAAIRPKTLRFNQPVAASVSCPRVSSCLFLGIVILLRIVFLTQLFLIMLG